jgi:hypothetical protein
MGTITEDGSGFPATVTKLETSDLVLGGPDTAPSNQPLKDLADRTRWLKNELARLEALIDGVSGGTTNHGLLNNRADADQHPITAITGLTNALAGKAAGAHTHLASAITDGTFAPERLPAATSSARGGVKLINSLVDLDLNGQIDAAVTADKIRELKAMIGSGGSGGTTDHAALVNRSNADQHPIAAITGLETALAGKAAGSHTHDASAITLGTMAQARLPAATANAAGIAKLINSLTQGNLDGKTDAAVTADAIWDLVAQVTDQYNRSLVLTYDPVFSSGWLKLPALPRSDAPTLPNTMYLQWRRLSGVLSGTLNTWPVAFTELYGALISEQDMGVTSDIIVGVDDVTATGFRVRAVTSAGLAWSGGFAPFVVGFGRIA